MRKPLMNKQQGFTLYMVLILMAVIAILVLAGSQLLNTEMRLSTNDADRKYAFGLAEDALRGGEQFAFAKVHKEKVLKDSTIKAALVNGSSQLSDFYGVVGAGRIFEDSCKVGLCAPSIESATVPGSAYSNTPAWERTVTEPSPSNKTVSVLESVDNSIEFDLGTSAEVSKNPRYIIEYLGPAEDKDTTLYRITARAWGRNQNTQVTLQSVIRVKNS